jgi:hypothetical protein
MVTFASDYSFGTANEEKVLPRIEKSLGTKLIHRGGMSIYDFDNGSNIFADVKTRRIKHNIYPTALIGANKVKMAAANEDKDFWFFFHYTDGLFRVKYDKDLFSKYAHYDYKRGDRGDFHNQPADTYFIPYTHLEKMI